MSYRVSVRTLCEFAARRGDLDLRFHLAPSGQEGMAGHRIVMSRRTDSYQKEVTLQAQVESLTVRGRADGFDPDACRLEEIKTYRGRLRDMPASQSELHWAQVRVYGHLMCQKLGLESINLALVYFNVSSGREAVRTESRSALELQQHFVALCDHFLMWARQEQRHRAARDQALLALRLPFDEFRSGQRTLAKAVYRGVRDGAHHAIQAPTGIGKTMGTLFPALKAMPINGPEKSLDKLFFLTAKTSGREVALHAARLIRKAGTQSLRVIELASREQACEHPDKHCHGQSCPLAKGFYDRLGPARTSAVQAGMLDRPALRRIGRQHLVCPYHLAMELVPWCDVVVGDYNYYFDVGASLHAQTETQQWRVAVLVDEAHNLVERARAMYTATLRLSDLATVSRATAGMNGLLGSLEQAWGELLEGQAQPYKHHQSPAQPFIQALKQVAGALSEQLETLEESAHDEVLRFYFDILHFLRLAESFGPHSVFETSMLPGDEAKARSSQCVIRNVMPAPYLKPRFEASRACVLFSATLEPREFYGDMLGLPDSTAWVAVEAPFNVEQLQVRVVADISTRWADREASLTPMARIVAAQYARQPGNYLVFASSFDYVHRLAATLTADHPDIPTWIQSRDMSNAAKQSFLERFDSTGKGIGFAVLGGVFAEGIDLPGRRLIGAFIATLGIPQVNPVNEALKQCLNASFAGRGHDYTYLYPGLRKVVQAAGRIIRTPQDEGVVYLMDDRYQRPAVQRLLPSWWRVERVKARSLLPLHTKPL